MNPTPTWKRLLAAALLAAVFSSPGRAEDQSTAQKARKALVSGDLEGLYTGQIQRAGEVGPAVAPGRSGIPAPQVPPLQVTGANNAPGQAPLDQAAVDKCLLTSNLDAQSLAFYREMLAKVQTSDAGRGTIENLLKQCQAGAPPVTIYARDWKDSAVQVTNGLEGIIGLGGQSTGGDHPTYEFNKRYMEFQNHDTGVQSGAAVMAHELTHIQFHREWMRDLPDYADVLDYVLLDEQNARAHGFLVAYQLAVPGGKEVGETGNAEWMADNPAEYFDEMKFWNAGYVIGLQQSELRDPVGVYTARLKILQDSLGKMKQDLADLPVRLGQIDHVLNTHADILTQLKQTDPVKKLRVNVDKDSKSLPHGIDQAEKGIKGLNELLTKLTGPNKDALLAKMRALSYDPAYAAFVARHTEEVDALSDLIAKHPLTKPAATDQEMSRAKFHKLFEALHGPDSFKKPSGWTEVNPKIEDLIKDYALKTP